MKFEVIPFTEAEALLDWNEVTNAIAEGHDLPRAKIEDTFLYRDPDTLLSRSAWIDGLGLAVKSAAIFPGNSKEGKPTINGGVCLFSDKDGTLSAVIDFHLVTKWKTVGDSLLAARYLARKDAERILIVGAGTVAKGLYQAYKSLFPAASFEVWNRTPSGAEQFAEENSGVKVAANLETAVRSADIITSATMTADPLIKGEWLQPGQHIDVIGAYRPDMRELDDAALQRGRLFVDNRDTTMGHIGELKIPLESGAIEPSDILADYYDLSSGKFARSRDADITIFKNGGGAHLDLMTCDYILKAWNNR